MDEETNESPIIEMNEEVNDHDPLINDGNTIFGQGKQFKSEKRFL
jgi:hypothetical protein